MDRDGTLMVVIDLSIYFGAALQDRDAETQKWSRIAKDLFLHTSDQQAWLQLEQQQAAELTSGELVIKSIRVSMPPHSTEAYGQWESRPGNIWLLRVEYRSDLQTVVTGIDVLFGTAAVDLWPGWSLVHSPLVLDAPPEVPIAKITVRHGRPRASPVAPDTPLRANHDGKFKIVQISDTHMVTGPGVCKDASDAEGRPLTDNSQSTLFKVVSPMMDRSIRFAVVFGNHDDEGAHALSRNTQMHILKTLPFNLAQAGPADIDGVSNYYIQIFGTAPSPITMATLYFIDSHGQIPSEVHNPDYKPIQSNQMAWFTETSQTLRKAREKHHNPKHVSLAFQHIPLSEFADASLITVAGHRREPTEGPSVNTHFYEALVEEGIVALGCGHDHVNDFCGLLPRKHEGAVGPWLCYGGGSGFGGYMSYGPNRYHRRARVWELDAKTGGVTTWKRVEYASERVDEHVLVVGGEVVPP
ncbi:hypothetical protein LTR91_022868 [Friedmanniomyces endolithicus]|uniref:Calcineurin-like phosphoesterase domain-containing protein n=1 Tax=Friedmanniomyces endolithicus TaxID=329885 RepID=A0AAN6H425_9PEZI|nr:hypothetical protein LTR57_025232 [Friedmanniomyces endolithicus]KAK0952361.1 hypothetical protein LTS01_024862 [Friedmanniomyces endolithicus]KAK0955427.1 hypothetical protein LTR91_022868 [Friedmanniomyces endolithicus]KAK1022028.1 hypothetical protein LTS16_026047 [Friedmanniomyces endolithicus]